jgi:hypothetical protein
MSAFEADRFNHSRTSPKSRIIIEAACPQGLKPASSLAGTRTAEAEPFAKPLTQFPEKPSSLAEAKRPPALTALSKKFLQYIRRTSGQHAAPNLHLMIQARVIYDLQNRMDCACL